MATQVRRLLIPVAVGITAAGLLSGPAAPASAALERPRSTFRYEVHHDSSIPLAQMPAAPLRDEVQENEPIHTMPNRGHGRHADPVVQDTLGVAAPTVGPGFDGLGQGFTGPAGTFTVTGAPPDTNAAVGASQIVEVVNTGFAVFAKSGTVQFGPAATNTLFSGFGGACETTNDGDGVVRYDALADRWIITQFANVETSGPFFECVAVSRTSDATGAYNRYSFQYASFPDYPKLSVWPDAYYMTYNLFSAGGTAFLGAEDCAMDRAAMLAGTAATQQCFTTSTSFGGLLGADFEGGTAPPAGAPNTVLALGTTSTTLVFWKFHVDWATPANSTFTGPTSITVASYTTACGSSGTCIPQSGTTQRLDSLSDRLMFRLAYRNFGDHEAVVVNHAVTAGTSVGVRWYELRGLSGTPTVFQQGTFAPDSTFRWMGSMAIDQVGNIGLGYSASSSTLHPQIRVTGRLAGDAAGLMTQGESTVLAGSGSQTANLSRWGDYASMTVDPTDGCTFWFAQEYVPTNGTFNWRTHLHSFTLPGCAAPVGDDFFIATSPASGTVTAGGSTSTTVSTAVTSGSAQSVTLSASGLPAGASASFSPSTVTAGGSSTLTVSTGTATPAGTFPITITGTGTAAAHTTTFTLTVNAASGCASPGQKLGNPGFESGSAPWTATAGVIGSFTAQPAHSGTRVAWLDGYGTTHTDTLAQSVSLPAGCSTYTLRFWLHIDTAETTTTTAFDTFRVQVVDGSSTTTLATFSNLNHANGYTLRSFNVAGFAGRTITVRFVGTEDTILQTSFVVDDTALDVA
jgi:hypothetical protein